MRKLIKRYLNMKKSPGLDIFITINYSKGLCKVILYIKLKKLNLNQKKKVDNWKPLFCNQTHHFWHELMN